MLDIIATYHDLVELNKIVEEINNLDWKLKHVANPLYYLDLPKWRKGSIAVACVLGVGVAIYYGLSYTSSSIVLKILNFLTIAIVLSAIFLGITAVLWFAVHLIFWLVSLYRKHTPKIIKKREDLLALRQQKLERARFLQKEISTSIVPQAYRTLSVVVKLYQYLQNGKAKDIKEAIHCYELDSLKETVKAQQQQINNMNRQISQLQQQNAWLARRTSRAKTSADIAGFLALLK